MFDGGEIILPLRNARLGEGTHGEMISTPVVWFLVTHPRGNVIIDGGNAAEVAVDPKAHWGVITETATAIMTPEQAVVPALGRAGFDLRSIRWILQSHLHIDHTGAVATSESFPNAEVLVTRSEWEWARTPDTYTTAAYCQADYAGPNIPWTMLEEIDDGWDLFGDGTIRCWRTPGHSIGHQSFEVTVGSGQTFILAMDAANTIDHLEERALPGSSVSAVDTARSVRRLRRLAWRSEAIVVAGHDPVQWPTFKHAPDFYA